MHITLTITLSLTNKGANRKGILVLFSMVFAFVVWFSMGTRDSWLGTLAMLVIASITAPSARRTLVDVVVDNTSAYRMDPEVPLVVPEINPEDLDWHKGIIANPNCSTIIMDVVVWPLYQKNKVERIVVSTYQAVSGAGAKAMEELEEQSRLVLAGGEAQPVELPHQIAFNLFSHNSPVGPDGYCEEEVKMIREPQKMFHDDHIRVTPTTVRVPVMRAHSEAINLQFSRPISPEEVTQILADAPGVRLVDEPDKSYFPMPIEASGIDDILVGRIRRDLSQPDGRGIDLFVSGDQLRKGAALNAVQIAEELIARKALRQAK